MSGAESPLELANLTGIDAELTLQELLSGIKMPQFLTALQQFLGDSVRLTDAAHNLCLGTGQETEKRVPIVLPGELEPVAYLEADISQEKLQAAKTLLQLLLWGNARYLMASDVHIRTEAIDYEALQHEHAALLASEARYKALAETLEEKVAEQVKTIETAHRKLYENEKLVAVGQLAAGMAHEINNPVGFIMTNLSTAQKYVDQLQGIANLIQPGADIDTLRAACRAADVEFLLDDFSALLNESMEGADRIATIVADLKGFSRVDEGGQVLADINEMIRQVCSIAAPRVRDRANVIQELNPLPLVRCHASELGQVFLSLLLNGADAMSGYGEIRMRTEKVDDTVRVQVLDNGCGIPESNLARIFEPFFTTKEVGQGVGLGLSVCYDVIKAHDGEIEVDTQEGVGTVFTVTLPVK